MLSITNAI